MSAAKRTMSDEFVVDSSDEESGTEVKTKKQKQATVSSSGTPQLENAEGERYFRLGPKKRLTVRKWKNMVLLDFREYYTDAAGEERPTKKGLSLTLDQWKILKTSLEDIDEAITRV
ncbi:transcriptional Coactivator p15-domain-containing protein [Thamnocephalis sphaerospora]|uniref:Transcriptional Coactivator p15-domain-containing protein n=1 Tax=Thamnocephalis sphaerospora TaxID=78915 RepID=A0A4P9XHW7_9FUNG|nr:transcriptional Coactivator p15-domain-containing protein [Thamnocephalis sphaerospora]|eukprot:RKP05226.1 transcriptional Coactivator p15-domain-containing protein [Thamnocephalis sphaerospora]